MYSQIISLRIKPGEMDRTLDILRVSVLPYLENRNGFASFLVFSCKIKQELILCTLWQSYQSMMDAENSGLMDRQIAKLSTVLAEPGEGDQYELEIFS